MEEKDEKVVRRVLDQYEQQRSMIQKRLSRRWLSASVSGVSVVVRYWFDGVALAEERKQNPLDLDKVTVTATRTKQDVDKAPASTTVVTQEEMQRKHSPTLDEALRNEVGLHVLKFRGPVDNHTTTIMRGFRVSSVPC